MYSVLSVLFLFLVRREIEQGPEPEPDDEPLLKKLSVVEYPVEVR